MKKPIWFWTMKKPQVPLAQGLHVIGFRHMKRNYGVDFDIPIKHVDGDIYFGKKEVDDLKAHIRKSIEKDAGFPSKIKEKLFSAIKRQDNMIEELKMRKPADMKDKELIKTFFEGYEAIGEITAFMSFKGTVQMSDVLDEMFRHVLSKKIADKEKLENIFFLLSAPEEASFMIKEQNSILEIAEKSIKGDSVEKLLNKHKSLFGWMGCVMYAGLPFDRAHYESELKEIMKKPVSEIRRRNRKIKKEREETIRSAVKKMRFSDDEKRVYQQFREWIHLRTFIKDMTSIWMEPTLPFLNEIAKRLDVKYNDLLYLSHTELEDIFEKNIFDKSMKRQSGWGCIYIDGKIMYYDSKSLDSIREKDEDVPPGITGMVACNGKVSGRAVIVTSIADIDRIEDGDILVTHMTTTNFVPVLAKVAAIVTDEGGITCHAAIVSREMNIPCIIGTRRATKAFRSGEILEVDAYEGIVRKV